MKILLIFLAISAFAELKDSKALFKNPKDLSKKPPAVGEQISDDIKTGPTATPGQGETLCELGGIYYYGPNILPCEQKGGKLQYRRAINKKKD